MKNSCPEERRISGKQSAKEHALSLCRPIKFLEITSRAKWDLLVRSTFFSQNKEKERLTAGLCAGLWTKNKGGALIELGTEAFKISQRAGQREFTIIARIHFILRRPGNFTE